MGRIYIVIYVILLYILGYWCALPTNFRQEQARLKYMNPKYIKDCSVLTARKRRNDPYLTNMTGTILRPFGNNVSFAFYLTLLTGGTFRIAAKTCESMKYKWMMDYMVQYTNMTLTCPIPAGRYSYYNLELPPKKSPIPLANGDYYIGYELFITATKEKIAEVVTLLHYTGNSAPDLNNKKKG